MPASFEISWAGASRRLTTLLDLAEIDDLSFDEKSILQSAWVPSVGDDVEASPSRMIVNLRSAWGPSVGDDVAPDTQPAPDFGTIDCPPLLRTLLDMTETVDPSLAHEPNLGAAWGPSVGDDVQISLSKLIANLRSAWGPSVGDDVLSAIQPASDLGTVEKPWRLWTLLDLTETADPSLAHEPNLRAAWGPSIGDDVDARPSNLIANLRSAWGPSVGDDVSPGIQPAPDFVTVEKPSRLRTLLDMTETADPSLAHEPNLGAAWGPSIGDDVPNAPIELWYSARGGAPATQGSPDSTSAIPSPRLLNLLELVETADLDHNVQNLSYGWGPSVADDAPPTGGAAPSLLPGRVSEFRA
jgi:hypothetical protein